MTYNPSGVAQQTMQSQQVMQTGGAYNGTVYEPFSNTTPSEASNPARISGPRREKIDNGDDGEGGEGGEGWIDKPDYGGTGLSPIGEPWIMALFALAFAGVIAIRQYKRKTVKSMNMKNSTNKFIATLALLCTLGVGQMWAAERSYDGTEYIYWKVKPDGATWWNDNSAKHYIQLKFNDGDWKWTNWQEANNVTDGWARWLVPAGSYWDIMLKTSNGNKTTGSSALDGNTSNNIIYNYGENYTIFSWSQSYFAHGAYVYFDNSTAGWDDAYKTIIIGRSRYSYIYQLSNFSNTNIWYYNTALTFYDFTEFAFIGTSSLWGNEENKDSQNPEARKAWATNKTVGMPKLMDHSSRLYNLFITGTVSDGVTPLTHSAYSSYTSLNSTQKVYSVARVPDGTYSSANAKANITMTSYALTGATTCTQQNQTLSTSESSHEINACRTASTSFTVADAAGYNFDGWYPAANSGDQLEDDATYTYRPTEATNVYARWTAKQSAITFDYQTSAAGYNDGANGITNVGLKGTYDAAMTTLTGSMPTAKNGYKFMGFYDATGGSGTKYYNADGTSAHVWDKDTESGTTLYAYYQPAEMSLALAAITIGTGEGDSATVSITPAVGSPAFNQVGTIMFCYDVKIKNGASMDPQPVGRQFTEGGVLKYRFASPRYSGNYTLNVKLRAGSDCSGAQIDSKDIDFIVSGDHTVTIRHKCGDVEIHEPTTVTIHPGEMGSAVGFEDADVFGYHFSTWTIGGASGVTKESGALTDRTITISAIYDGTITATYTRRNLIYFKNTLGWSDVWIHFLGSTYWNSTTGTGNLNRANRNKHMTRIGETDVWYYDYSANSITPNGYEVFTDREFVGDGSNGYGSFHGDDASHSAPVVYPRVPNPASSGEDSKFGWYNCTTTSMFVPLSSTEQTGVEKTVVDGKKGIYYDKGYWRTYEPVTGATGYTLKIYNKTAADSRKELQSKTMADGSNGVVFEATVDLEAGKTYGVKFIRGTDMYFTNTSANLSDGNSYIFQHEAENYAAAEINTTVAGNYTFRITCDASDGNMKMSVKFPASTNDYRIVYHDGATWTPENGLHAAGWIHPSHVITKRDGGEDIVSFFVKADASPKFKFQKITGLNPVAWSDVETGEGDHFINVPDSITDKGTGVYNFHLKQENGSISVVKIEPYTGNYYIRTDNAGSTKWSDFRSSDHLMTYSEYADKKKDFTHYYMKFVTTNVDDATSYTAGDANIKDVRFCIANDYSSCISDTLKQSTNDATNSHVDANGDLQADANIRFMWNNKTNALSRKYLSRGQSNGSYFLVLKGENSTNLTDPNGTALSNGNGNNRGVGDNEIQFKDNQDWIYEAEVKAKPGGRIKLYARYHSEDQYFYGDNDASFTGTHGEELIGGSGSAELIRAIYDFKTDRLMAAWVPRDTIKTAKTIEADIMLVREQQNGGGQINLTVGASLATTSSKSIYGVMRFNRWDLNNLSRESGHAALDPGDQKTAYERFNYFISFPFDVKVGEIFGFGRIGRHYRIYFYDGIGRAQEGFFAERKTNWKMIDDTDSILHAYQGYFLQLNSVRMATDKTDVWPQAEQSEVELYFPAMRAISSITIANETIPALALDGPYKCNKDLSSLHGGNQDANRTNKDSYWRCIGTPSFANYDANFVGWTGFHYQINSEDVPFLYQWETTTNKLIPVTSNNFEFLSMHAYLIQNPNEIVWTSVSKPTYSAVVARTRDAEAEREWKLTLTNNNEELLDQAFVRMSDNEAVTAKFDFGQDLVKEWNEDANIYTFIESEQVAANSMPFSDQTTIVPVGVKIASDGEYTFAMPEGTNGVGVVLVDNIAGTRTNLALENYTVNLAAGQYDGRFFLEISPIVQSPTGIEQTGSERKDSVRKVMIDGILYIVKDGRIYDATGNRVQ